MTTTPSPWFPAATIEHLRGLVDTYKAVVAVPEYGRWRGMTDSELWLALVTQVSVVGAERGGAKLSADMATRSDWYERLVAMDAPARCTEVHATLRRYAVRYAGKEPGACRKTQALVRNLAVFIAHGGPRRYYERVAQETGERARIAMLLRDFQYIGLKSARDQLIGLGFVRDALAFDTRVMNALEAFGATLPRKLTTDAATYAAVEADLIERVCRPAGVSGAVLDRILFQKYAEIMPGRAAPAPRARKRDAAVAAG